MCYHKSSNFKSIELNEYYDTYFPEQIASEWDGAKHFHDNGFDHNLSPVLTNEGIGFFRWGLVPHFAKSVEDANILRVKNLNCRSEEMYEKNTWKPSLESHQRCLIPLTGFFDHHWNDAKGKDKIPYYVKVKGQNIFSTAGLYVTWNIPGTDDQLYSYTILTTEANPLMSYIHNSKKRMPLIVPREYEKDWLNPNLSKEDVLALCQPFDEGKMEAYTISKRITSKESNVAEVLQQHDYHSTGSLF